MRRFFLVSAAALALAAPASAQVVSNGSPTSDVGPLGKDAITAVAQPFVSPISVYLQSFTFYLGNAFIGDQAFFTAAIYQFSNNATSGLALFTSDPFAGVGDPNADQPITIGSLTTAPLNIALSANTVYALILSSLDDNGASTPGAEDQVGLASTAMFGGLLATTETDLTQPDAFQSVGLNDLAFTATLTTAPVTSTPEPATLTLLATGLAGVGGVGFGRRRKGGAAA